VLLAIVGGAVGLLLGWGVVSLFSHAKSFALPQFNVIQLNGTVLVFTFLLALATGALFGLAPSIHASRADLHQELKGGAGRSVSPSRGRRLASDILVVGEIALSLLLLSGAGLLLKDFVKLRNVDVGVRTEGVWTGALQLPQAHYDDDPRQFQFAQALLEKLRHIPGVDAAALSGTLPLEGGSNGYISLQGKPSTALSGPLVESHSVSPDYFRAMGVPLISGRMFTAADVDLAAKLDARGNEARRKNEKLAPDEANAMIYPTVINQTMARYFWPNQDPVGQMFSGGGTGPWRQVIGVVGDVKEWGLTHATVPEAYSAFDGAPYFFIVLHTPLRASTVTSPVRRILAQMDASLPLFNVRGMNEVIGDGAQGSQFLSLLVGSFAAFAALLAAVGIYGVLSYVVNQRTREIGIRMSLGATRGRVLAQVLYEGMRLAILGFAIGIAGAFAAGRVMASLLHGVDPRDLGVLLGTTGLLALITFGACYVPALRAARLDPMSALRQE
jgi:putative ABC transport system permease protein